MAFGDGEADEESKRKLAENCRLRNYFPTGNRCITRAVIYARSAAGTLAASRYSITPKGEEIVKTKGKTRALLLAGGVALAVILSAEAAPYIQGISAIGTANDSDQNAARSAAKENAEANLFCAGVIQEVRTVVSGCVDLGNSDSHNWMCTATARAQCVIGR